jgi:hypothetical protein
MYLRDQILQLNLDEPHLLLKEMANKLHTSETYVGRVLNGNGIKRRQYTPPNRISFSSNQIEEILVSYRAGNSCNEIAKNHKVCVEKINKVIRQNGCEIRDIDDAHRIYPSTNIFEHLDDKSAYFLGLLYADGNVSSSTNAISISLIDTERSLLEELSKAIYGEVRLRCIYPKKDTHTAASAFCVRNRSIKESLCNLGCGPRKSLTVTFPEISEDLVSHFIRGYFDGDGGVHKSKKGQIVVGIVGTFLFLDGVASRLKQMGCACYIYRHGSIWKLLLSAEASVLRFYRYIYKNAFLWSERKQDILRSSLISKFGQEESWPSDAEIDNLPHPNGKRWRVKDPSGKIFIVNNLSRFCREQSISYFALHATSCARKSSRSGWSVQQILENEVKESFHVWN